MGLLDGFEKLINEHGSSAILRERLELFSDKYSMLEEKNKHLTEKSEELETQLETAKKEISGLQEKIKSIQSSIETNELDQNEQDILTTLLETNQNLFSSHISQRLNIPIGNAEYHLDNLVQKDLILPHYNYVEGTRYSINSNGRKYIIDNTQ